MKDQIVDTHELSVLHLYKTSASDGNIKIVFVACVSWINKPYSFLVRFDLWPLYFDWIDSIPTTWRNSHNSRRKHDSIKMRLREASVFRFLINKTRARKHHPIKNHKYEVGSSVARKSFRNKSLAWTLIKMRSAIREMMMAMMKQDEENSPNSQTALEISAAGFPAPVEWNRSIWTWCMCSECRGWVYFWMWTLCDILDCTSDRRTDKTYMKKGFLWAYRRLQEKHSGTNIGKRTICFYVKWFLLNT